MEILQRRSSHFEFQISGFLSGFRLRVFNSVPFQDQSVLRMNRKAAVPHLGAD
jgi:hypothetical protein